MAVEFPQNQFLSEIKLLTDVPNDVLADFTNRCELLTYNDKDIIMERDDFSSAVYFVVKGRVRVLDYSNELDVVFAEIGAGETFGEMSAIDAKQRSARVVAMERTKVAILSREDFKQLLLQVPEVGLLLMNRFVAIIRQLNQRVTAFSTMTTQQRVYMELLRLSAPNLSGDGTWVIDRLPNHQEIASVTSTLAQDVAEAIGDLARAGLVTRKHKTLLVNDDARLVELANL